METQKYKQRLNQLKAEIRDSIREITQTKCFISGEPIPISNLTINKQPIINIWYYDGWRMYEIQLNYINNGDGDWFNLSKISNINDLLKILNSLENGK